MTKRMMGMFLVVALALPFNVNAILIGSTDGLFDSSSGLEWLNTDLNEGIGYNTMIAADLNGYAALGYRYAAVA